jgi:C-terminal domain 9 of the ABC-three component (ABC-3C) systems
MNAVVSQKGASAGGDIVGGDKITKKYYGAIGGSALIEQLLQKLQVEIDKNQEVRHTVEALQYFYTRIPADGVDGLEAKLSKGGRDHERHLALEKKELFAKYLERWSLYASAQEIFACLLAKVEHEFTYGVFPKIGKLDEAEINQIITDKIVIPTIAECGTSVFSLNHAIVMGMVYWLAEQCFVRWHK